MSVSQTLLQQRQDSILRLTLNRPERRNALSPELYDSLLVALEDSARDRTVRVVILTGAGEAFCAGGDVVRMAGIDDTTLGFEERVIRLRSRNRVSELLHEMGKPTIAMIRGACVGAGMSVALACDLRLGDTTARMKTGFLQVGLAGDFGGHYFLPRIVGPAKACELYLTSPMLDADELMSLGLLNRLTAPAALEETVMQIARSLADASPVALAYMKRNLEAGSHSSLGEVLDLEAWQHIRCTETPEHRQAVLALAAKRARSSSTTGKNHDRAL